MVGITNKLKGNAMGKKYIVFDDIDQTEGAETRSFSVDGSAYEIDLTDVNFGKLEKALEPYIDAGRRAGRASSAKSSSTGSKKVANPELDAIRQWASKNGLRVSDKGRIPRDVVQAYEAANSQSVAPSTTGTVKAKVTAKAPVKSSTPEFAEAH